MKLSEIKPNPSNPRIIKDDKFKKLVQSLKDFPKMMALRPIIIDETGTIQGGNMRYKALKELGFKEVPDEWIKQGKDLTAEQWREFVVKDNVGFGEWDLDILANEWDAEKLEEWGVDLHISDKPEKETEQEEKKIWTPDCLFASNNIYDIPTLLIEMQATTLDLPIKPYGAEKRDKKNIGTYHFYVDDYRFNAIWDNPENLIYSGCKNIIEPNISLFDTTPIGYGIFQIYKKRWISRFLQDNGISVFIDLNVSSKFYEYNLLGVPEEWNAFATRGYADRIPALTKEIEIAKRISGLDNPYMVVYGGGKKIHEISAQNNCIFVEQFMQT